MSKKGHSTTKSIEEISLTRVGTLQLKKPVEITIRDESSIFGFDDYFVAENDELDIWASGDTREEAIEGFKIYFVDDWETYSTAEKLVPSAQKYYERYKAYL